MTSTVSSSYHNATESLVLRQDNCAVYLFNIAQFPICGIAPNRAPPHLGPCGRAQRLYNTVLGDLYIAIIQPLIGECDAYGTHDGCRDSKPIRSRMRQAARRTRRTSWTIRKTGNIGNAIEKPAPPYNTLPAASETIYTISEPNSKHQQRKLIRNAIQTPIDIYMAYVYFVNIQSLVKKYIAPFYTEPSGSSPN